MCAVAVWRGTQSGAGSAALAHTACGGAGAAPGGPPGGAAAAARRRRRRLIMGLAVVGGRTGTYCQCIGRPECNGRAQRCSSRWNH